MAKVVLDNIASGFNLSKINNNFTKLATELNDKVLYRNNPTGEPNAFESDLDLNGNSIFNVQDLHVAGALEVHGVNLADQIALSQMYAEQSRGYRDQSQAYSLVSLSYSNASAASASQSALSSDTSQHYMDVSQGIASALAGGTIGFDAVAYDFGAISDTTTYFNRDFGTLV